VSLIPWIKESTSTFYRLFLQRLREIHTSHAGAASDGRTMIQQEINRVIAGSDIETSQPVSVSNMQRQQAGMLHAIHQQWIPQEIGP